MKDGVACRVVSGSFESYLFTTGNTTFDADLHAKIPVVAFCGVFFIIIIYHYQFKFVLHVFVLWVWLARSSMCVWCLFFGVCMSVCVRVRPESRSSRESEM